MTSNQKIQELSELPSFQHATFGGGEPPTALPKWTGMDHPPKVGAIVNLKVNQIGPAAVRGYFLEDGWLGLKVFPLDPPDWYVRQNGLDKPLAFVSGKDVEAVTAALLIASPNGWERGALQIFADSRGRRWKDELLVVWHNGRDDYEAGGNYLRQVRNQLGPAWLHSKECTIKPASAKPKPSSPGF